MLKTNKKTIFVCFGDSAQEITLLGTGLLDSLLQKGYHLVIILSSNQEKQHLEEYFRAKDITIIKISQAQPKAGLIESLLRGTLFSTYIKKMPPVRKKILQSPELKNKGFKLVLRNKLLFLLSFIPEQARLWMLYNFYSYREADLLFKKYKPSLVVFSSAGIRYADAVVVRSAKKYACKTISVDACWDLMEDATWFPILDKLLVWNEQMKREAIEYHGYPPKQVEPVGILRCDFYRKKELLQPRDAFFRQYRLDEKQKLITVALNPVCPSYVWREIIKTIRYSSEIKYPVQLLIRPFPSESENFLNEIGHDPLIRFAPAFNNARLIGISDIASLANILAHSDIIISLLSTLILESCYFDRPNISIAFTPVRDYFYSRDFIQPFLREKGISIAANKDELISAINLYLQNPGLGREGRKRILDKFCFGRDAKATERTLAEIEKLIF